MVKRIIIRRFKGKSAFGLIKYEVRDRQGRYIKFINYSDAVDFAHEQRRLQRKKIRRKR